MMKWITFWLLAWCFTLLVCAALLTPGCATLSNQAKPNLSKAMATATEAKAVAKEVCAFDWHSSECWYLVQSLKNFYALVIIVRQAEAQGHDVTEAIKALEDLGEEILGVGRLVLKQTA
jgi:hypothetical protein